MSTFTNLLHALLTYSDYKYLDYIIWWMYILSHFGRSYCVFQIVIQMTVTPRISCPSPI